MEDDPDLVLVEDDPDLVLVEDDPELLHDPGLCVEELDGEADQAAARHAAREVLPATVSASRNILHKANKQTNISLINYILN